MPWPLLIPPCHRSEVTAEHPRFLSGNVSNCPPQKNASKEGEKRHSTHGQCIDCDEPRKLASNRHPSHPFSGVLPRKIQYANAEHPSTTGVTMIAPMSTNSWLVEDDAASQRETLNGTMLGNTIHASPEMPTTKRNKPRIKRIAGLTLSASTANAPAATANQPRRQDKARVCNAHCERTPGSIYAPYTHAIPNK